MQLSQDSRFQLVRRLGFGAMGSVYEAIDREREAHVALKRLHRPGVESVEYLKREFRALRDIDHPNLVGLGELVEEKGQWFFTMELVNGIPFLEWVRNDPGRLIPGVQQLASGLHHLHEHGKVHRDIKPSNILVTESGRVVILDFGLVSDDEGSYQSIDDSYVVGSAAYMAPEQAGASRVGPAADWYSVGVLIFEALTGELPFVGTPLQILTAKQSAPARSARELAPSAPPVLTDLSERLLESDPERRPLGTEVLAALKVEPESCTKPAQRPRRRSHGFVGRDAELAQLHHAFATAVRGHAVTVVVHGDSGVGKSALLNEFAAELGEQAVILRGTCYEREWVPYKGMDGVFRGLGRFLRSAQPELVEQLLPEDAALLRGVFPALRRVRAFALAREQGELDVAERRRRLLVAVRELMTRLSGVRPLVICVEDCHWIDADGRAVLTEILREPDSPPALCVLTVRSSGHQLPRWLRDLRSELRGDVRELELGPLPPDDATLLAQRLLGDGEAEEAEELARECGGHPLFMEVVCERRNQLGRPATTALDEVLTAGIADLSDDELALLQLFAISGAPLPLSLAARVTDIHASRLSGIVRRLQAVRLIRLSAAGDGDAAEIYHERVRRAVTRSIAADAARAIHSRLASVLEALGSQDHEALMVHLSGAGKPLVAAEYAYRAANAAAGALAFDRAARLYRATLDHLLAAVGVEQLPGELREVASALDAGLRGQTSLELERSAVVPALPRVWEQLGEALANSGQGASAAVAFGIAAGQVAALAALDLRRRAAEQLIQCGAMDDGLQAVSDVLAEVGLKLSRSRSATITRHLLTRLRLRMRGLGFKLRRPDEVPREVLVRLDCLRSAGSLLMLADTVRAAQVGGRYVIESLEAGDPESVASALAGEGLYQVAFHRNRRVGLELIDQATEIAEGVASVNLHGYIAQTLAMVSLVEGQMPEGAHYSERAIEIYRTDPYQSHFHLANTMSVSATCLLYLGDFQRFRRQVPGFLRWTKERGNNYATAALRAASAWVWLADDAPEVARRELDFALEEWTHRHYHMQHLVLLRSQVLVDHYLGNVRLALERVEKEWPQFQSSLLRRVRAWRIWANCVRGRAMLAAASADLRGRAAAHLREVDDCIKRLEGEGLAWSAALAALQRAGAAYVRRDLAASARGYRDAGDQFHSLGMRLYEAACYHRAGQLGGGAEGQHFVEEAERQMTAQGIVDPHRYVRLLLAPLRGIT